MAMRQPRILASTTTITAAVPVVAPDIVAPDIVAPDIVAPDVVAPDAGALALRIAEVAATQPDAAALALALTELLVPALGASCVALFRPRAPSARPSLERLALAVAEPAAVPGSRRLYAAASRAIAQGRMLAISPGTEAATADHAGARMLALPLGTPLPVGALVLSWREEARGASEADSWRIALLVRLAPTLALATRSLLVPPPAALADADEKMSFTHLLPLMSHELRTPLNTINGFLEIVLDGLAGPLAERQAEFLAYAHGSARHLIALIEDILLLSRADTGPSMPRLSPIDLATLASQACDAAREAAATAEVALTMAIAPALPPPCGDAARLQQALGILLRSAIARTPPRGTVHLEISPCAKGVRLVVRDTGPVIPAVEWARLFEPFRPLTRESLHYPGATGLDLAVAHAIVTRHGGTLAVESEAQGGATFRAIIPVENHPRERQQSERQQHGGRPLPPVAL
ncbi:MAG: HAMP domain-containing histidine kinase [Ktedonobacterales bacterium]|nr:HAMP domain-containing histidine kinase [Ktedonobacterales bacterium]